MKNEQLNLDFYAKVKADVTDAKNKIQDLKKSLSTLELPKGATREFQSSFKKIEDELRQFEVLSSKDIKSPKNVNKIASSWDRVINLMKKVGIETTELSNQADQILPKSTLDRINKATEALKNYSKAIDAIKAKETERTKQMSQESNQAKQDVQSAVGTVRQKRKSYDNAVASHNASEKIWLNSGKDKALAKARAQKEALEKEKIAIDEAKALLKEKKDSPFPTKKSSEKLRKEAQSAYEGSIKNADSKIAQLEKQKQSKLKDTSSEAAKQVENLKAEIAEAKAILTEYKKDPKKNIDNELENAKRQKARYLKKTSGKVSDKDSDWQAILSRNQKAEKVAKLPNLEVELKKAEAGLSSGADITKIESEIALIQAEKVSAKEILDKAIQQANELENTYEQHTKDEKAYEEASNKSKKLAAQISDIKEVITPLEKEEKKLLSGQENIAKLALEVQSAEQRLSSAQEKVSALDKELETLIDQEVIERTKVFTDEFKEITGVDISAFARDTDKVENVIKDIRSEEISKVNVEVEKMANNFRQAEPAVEKVGEAISDAKEEAIGLAKADEEFENLKQSMTYFFSIGNAIQLFKRALDSAYNTVKELDKAMTETAVVTDFSIDDMWNQLPQYTESANKLGTTTLGAYETMTLFYQQGLKTNEVFQVGEETMKMARIAGLDYANATNLMTAALRGFNMELNTTSSQRVNDVYSELAAITAADTQEIAKAMTKTASIANSANMEFETTAAFLSQIIETTRENAETAGTAMKTVIARFQELKKSPEEMREVDGEVVDANKIEGALRGVGVALRDSEGQFRNLDEVFLELASKWSGLDRNTQRYIATIAAGSRQQSRFIAMMSDYGRTMELVDAANHSAGASQKQYEKTLDSLETALNRLSNAWDQFAMGLANQELIKVAVEGLTELLTVINNLTDALPGFGSSFAKMATVVGALKVGKALFNTVGDSLKGGLQSALAGAMGEAGQQEAVNFGKGFKANLGKEFGKMKNVFQGFSLKGMRQTYLREKADKLQEAFDSKQDYADRLWAKGEERESQIEIKDGHKRSNKGQRSVVKDAYDLYGHSAQEQKQADQLGEELDKVQGKLTETTKGMTKEQLAAQKLAQQYAASSAAAGTLAGVLGLISKNLEAKGMDKEAQAVRGLATAFGLLASALMIIPPILKSMNIALGPSGIAIMAIIALIGGAVYAIGAMHETAEEKLKRLQQESEKAKQAFEEAKKAEDDLFNAKTGYEETQKHLEDLVKGTQEWKDALIEANQQVSQLLTIYPELAKYVTQDGNGAFAISEEGWNKLSEIKAGQTRKASAIATGKSIELLNQEETIATSKLAKEVYGVDWAKANKGPVAGLLAGSEGSSVSLTGPASGLLKESGTVNSSLTVEKINDFFEKHKDFLYDSKATDELTREFESLATEMHTTGEALFNMKQDFVDYSNFLESQKQKKAIQANILLTNSLNPQTSKSKYSGQVTEAIGNNIAEGLSQEVQDYYSNMGDDPSKELADKYNILNPLAGIDGYKQIYKAMTGVDAGDMSLDAIKDAIAQNEVAETFSTKADEIISVLDDIAEDAPNKADLLAGFISGDSKNFRMNQTDNPLDLDDEKFEKEYGLTKDKLATYLGYENIDELNKAWNELLGGFSQEKNQSFIWGTNDGLKSDWIDYNKIDFLNDATLEQYKSYINLLTDSLGRGGIEAATEFQKNFSQIMAKATPEQRDLILNSLDTFDFTKEGSIQDFFESLEQIGVVLPDNLVLAFTKDLQNLGKAFKEVDVSKVREEIKSLLDLADSIEEKEKGDRLTEDEYQTLLKAGISDSSFAWDGQGWIYLEGPMSDLAAAVRENTAATLEENRAILQKRIDNGEKVKETLSTLQNDTLKEDFLNGMLPNEWARTIFALPKDYTEAQVSEYSSQALTDYNNLEGNKSKMATYNEQAAATNFAMMSNEQIADVETGTLSPAELEAYNKNLERLMVVTPGAKEEVDYLKKAIKQTNSQVSVSDKVLKSLAVETVSSAQKIKKLAETVEKNADVFKKGNRAIDAGEKPLNEYYVALSEITEAAKEVFGDNITEELVKNNRKAFEDLAKGGEEGAAAFEQISEIIRNDMISAIASTESEVANLQAYLQGVDLSFQANGYADVTDIVNKMIEAGYSVDAIAEKIKGLTGLDVAFDVETQTIKIPSGDLSSYAGAKVVGSEGMFLTVEIPKRVKGRAIATGGGYKGSGYTPSNAGGGGGGKDKDWENPYDKLYNLYEKINEELRIREKLEHRYQHILDSENASANELTENLKEQMQTLKNNQLRQEKVLKGKNTEMKAFMAENSDMNKYGYYDEKTGTIVIDYELIDSVKDPEEGERISTYISGLEGLQDQIEEAEDALMEIEDSVKEIEDRGEDEYFSLEQRIKDAVVGNYQDQIDELSKINETVTEANNDILDAMQKSIERERQERDNDRAEQEIEEKQRRLLFLGQDTSGANQLEMLELEEDLMQQQEDYTDTLIDQKISALQEQNELAAQQRQQQIDIAQSQLNHYVETGNIWSEVQRLMIEGLDKEKGLVRGSALETLLQKQEGFKGMSELESMKWLTDLNTDVANALTYLEDIEGSVTGKDSSDDNNNNDNNRNSSNDSTENSGDDSSTSSAPNSIEKQAKIAEIEKNIDYFRMELNRYRNDYEEAQNAEESNRAEKAIADVKQTIARYQQQHIELTGYRYKTGGLANYTGPAWLDGTRSHPELVLNARDTENFIQLKDILRTLFDKQPITSTENNGDNIYDIDINVENIGNDYDVEQVAGAVENIINRKARYRNNTAVSLSR